MEYQPLDASKNEIRLLWIESPPLPVSGSDQIIHCSLRTVSLNEYSEAALAMMSSDNIQSLTGAAFWEAKLAKYQEKDFETFTAAINDVLSDENFGRWTWGDFTALSYTWGSIDNTRDIIVNGQRVQVGENLEGFLRYMKTDPDNRERIGIWVDALCINQSDTEERNTEVKRMADIYRGALTAIAWLGEEADESPRALRLLNTIANYDFGPLEKWESFLTAFRENSHFFEVGSWRALYNLFNRPYWTRLWIVQEIALSGRGLNIICGHDSINWFRLSGAVNFLSNELDFVVDRCQQESNELGVPVFIGLIVDRIYRMQQLKMFNDVVFDGMDRPILSETLTIARYSEQQDAKDKIYGVLSLIDPLISRSISPNYNLSLLGVYTEFAKTCIRETGSLDIICQSRSELLGTEEFPSWVPDWRRRGTVNLEMTQKLPFHTSGSSKVDITFEDNDRQLRVRGFRVDTIDGLGHLGEMNEEGHAITQPIHSYGKSPYGDERGIKSAFWQTFVTGRNPWGELAPSTYDCLVHIQWHNPSVLANFSENLYFGLLQDIIDQNKSLLVGNQSLWELLGHSETQYDFPSKARILEAAHRAVSVKLLRRFIITAKGYIGLATKNTRQGDIVCILFGCSTPVILRPSNHGAYNLVGDCYVHGIMEGEAMEWMEKGLYSTDYFRII